MWLIPISSAVLSSARRLLRLARIFFQGLFMMAIISVTVALLLLSAAFSATMVAARRRLNQNTSSVTAGAGLDRGTP